MNRNLQIIVAWMGTAAVIAGAYGEWLGLPSWFEDFAIFGVMPVALILVLLLGRRSRPNSDTANSTGWLQRLWNYKPNRPWVALVIMGFIAVVSLLLPPSSHIPLHANLAISLFAFVFGVAVVFIAVRWRRH